jgi:two-component system nitrogen regulation sensor histidine kinase NtrY
VSETTTTRPAQRTPRRKTAIVLLAIGSLLLFGILLSLTSFNLPFLNPDSNQQLLFFVSLTSLIFLLFVALTFVLARNLLKLFAERRLGVLGSKFRTRLVVAGLLLSFLPVIVMFLFAYGLMNRSIDKWFSSPVTEVRQDTSTVMSLLSSYAAQNAKAEAVSIAASAVTQRAFADHNFDSMESVLQQREITLQGGFVFALADGEEQASFGSPAPWGTLKKKVPAGAFSGNAPVALTVGPIDYILGSALAGNGGEILVGMPLPAALSDTVKQLEASQERYLQLHSERKLVRRTYMGLLLLLTVLVLFATTWLALFLSKLVTRPVAALAEAMQEISRGRLDYRVEIRAADEIGDLVNSFNRMAAELEISRQRIDASSHDLSAANVALEQRRQHIETILQNIPTGVLSLDADRRVTHVNDALVRMFHLGNEQMTPGVINGTSLNDLFSKEVLEDLIPLLRRAERMGTTTTQMEIAAQRNQSNVAVTVSSLSHHGERLGYVVVFEDLSDLLQAQRQAAWREVARRVAHEIKNPLTPIALSAERIRRHLDRDRPLERSSLEVLKGCAETISGAVETVRTLVDEFSTLARFPAAQPQPTDLNAVIESTLAMFNGRLDKIQVRTSLDADLPNIMADPEGMKRALSNLVDNAAEAMDESMVREIQISTCVVNSRDAVELTVADTGHGVTEETKQRLFLPYFSTKKRGTGLGLAIVSRIIEDHHGSIRVEENRPVGARFIIELPLALDGVTPTENGQHA